MKDRRRRQRKRLIRALDASLVIIESNGTESQGADSHKQHIKKDDHRHIEQPEFYNEGKVDQNAQQCHDIRPLPAKLTDNMTTELSNQSLESENVCLKKTVAQFQKDFLRMEAHCVNLELKFQIQALKDGQHAYKEMFDSIKTTRVEHRYTTSLIANNDKFKAQLQEKGFAIAALKNELRKLTGNSVNTKFAKPSILGKLVVNNDLSKPVTTHHLPKGRESAPAKPHHMIDTKSI
ncbi:hypothetical protein Tco_0472305 [Tanacetum coccineum]